MSEKEQPLPKPPTKAFGRKNNFEEQEEQASLMADRMAQAAAEGKLDEFLKQEMPDNEYARNLASMMMGMTGMMPGTGAGMNPPAQPGSEASRAEKPQAQAGETPAAEVPDDVRQAIMGGDVQSLMGMLRREHQKRNPDSPLLAPEEKTEAALLSPPHYPNNPLSTKKSLILSCRSQLTTA